MSKAHPRTGHDKSKKKSDSPDDSAWSLQSCADALVPLLESDEFSNALTPSQLDAIRYLRSVSSSGDDESPGRIRRILKGRLRRKMEKFITETFAETEEADDGAMSAYHEVLHAFGGRRVFQSQIHVRTKTDRRKTIPLRGSGARPSGNRINLMIEDYRVGGSRKLVVGRLSTLSYETLDDAGSQSGSQDLVTRRLSTFSETATDEGSDFEQNCPPEWNALPRAAKSKLVKLLSWENLSKWEFNIVEVAKLTTHPLLLVGWALLCEPMAQEAMVLSVGVDAPGDAESYRFYEYIKVNPRTVCNFLREIESRYDRDNPYHNNIHAADVAQTTHCLFQLMGEEHLRRIYDPIQIFSLLLAATFHDVCHPGTNNLFHQNAMTPLAIEYNDVSVLENMHSAVGHSLLLGEERRKEWDIFDEWEQGNKVHARNVMRTSILCTDMSNHFAHMEELDSLIGQVRKWADDRPRDDADAETSGNGRRTILSILARALEDPDGPKECDQLADLILKFLMHAADISNPSKPEDLAVYWADRALSEFFAQGDKEREMELPISPLCDRNTVSRNDSQVGFIKFVIQPTFELLGEIIPRVKEEIVPVIDRNLDYWKISKLRESLDR